MIVGLNVHGQLFDWAITTEPSSPFANEGESNSIAIDGDGNVFITGYFTGKLDFDYSSDTLYLTDYKDWYDFYLAKYDSSGTIQWAFSFGHGSIDEGYALATDENGNVYVTGSASGKIDFDPSPDSLIIQDPYQFLAKYDADGNFKWVTTTGGIGFDISYLNSGHILMTGNYNTASDFDPGTDTLLLEGYGIFFSKYDTAGNFLWVKGISNVAGGNMGYALDIDLNGDIIIAGGMSDSADFDPSLGSAILSGSSPNTAYCYLAKYDSFGNYKWAQIFGTTKSSGNSGVGCFAVDVAVDDNGNIFLTGQIRDTVDFDPSSSEANLIGPVFGNIFIAKFDSAGSYKWGQSIGNNGFGYHTGNALALDKNQNVILTGKFVDTINVGQFTIPSSGNGILLAKYSSAGDELWAFGVNAQGGYSSSFGLDLALNNSHDPHITSTLGYVTNSDFDPSNNVVPFSGRMFIAKYTDTLQFIGIARVINPDSPLRPFPNPNVGAFYIESKITARNRLTDIRVYNSIGDEINATIVGGDRLNFDISKFPPGIYLIVAKNKFETYTAKVVKLEQ